MCQLRGLDFPDQAMLTELEAIERTPETKEQPDIAQPMAAWSPGVVPGCAKLTSLLFFS